VARSSVTVAFVGDTSSLERSISQVTSKADEAAGHVGKVGEKAGEAGHRGVAGFTGFNEALRATGTQMGPLGEALEHVGATLERLGEHGASAAEKIRAVGVGIAALGGLAFAAGAKDEAAMANLSNSIKDTGHSMSEYKDEIEKVTAAQAEFGHKGYEVADALTVLTTATQDPKTAIEKMGLVADLAARQTISLKDAADELAGVYVGKFKSVAKILGPTYHDLIDPAKELTHAHGEEAAAADRLGNANQRLSDFNARLAESEARSAEVAASRVTAAQQHSTDADTHLTEVTQANADKRAAAVQHAADRMTAADQKVADVRSRIASMDTGAQSAVEAASQHLADVTASQADQRAAAETNAAAAVEAAHERTMAADQALADLEANIAARTAPTIAEKYALISAEDALAKVQRDHADGVLTGVAYTDQLRAAEQRLQQTKDTAAEKAKTTQQEEQQVARARDTAAKAAEAETAAEAKRQTAGQQTLAEQVAMRQAVDAQAKAQEHLAAVMSDAGKLQLELVKAIEKQGEAHKAATSAGAESRAEHDRQAKALETVGKAHDALAKAQAAAVNAGRPTLAQQIEERKLREGVTKAQEFQRKATEDLLKAQKDQADFGPKVQQVLKALEDRTKGAAQAQADTTKGMFDSFLAKSDNFLAQVGQKYGGAAMAIGLLMASGIVPAMARIGAAVASTVVAIIGELLGMSVAAEGSFAAMVLDALAWAGSMVAAGATAMLPFLPIIAIVAAVGFAAWELYKHWDTVWGFIKDIASDAWHFLEKVFGWIVDVAIYPVKLEIAALEWLWGKAWDGIGAASSWVWDHVLSPVFGFFSGAFDGLSGALYGFWSYVEKAWNGIGGAISWVWVNVIKPIFDTIQGAIKDITGGVKDVIGIGKGVGNAVGDAASTVGSFLGFADGGPVPGPLGIPRLVVVHGGEYVLSQEMLRGGMAGGSGVTMAAAGGGDTHVTLNVNLHVEGAVITDTSRFIQSAKEQLTDAVHETLLRRKARGGSILLA